MSDNNDFLKGYKQKNDSGLASEGDSKAAAKQDDGMSFEEKNNFQKTQPKPVNPERNYYQESRNSSQNKNTKNKIAIGLSVFSVLLIVITILVVGGKKISLPDFRGWSKNDFMLWASQNEVLTQMEEQYSDDIEADKVISQAEAPGTKIKKGEFVKVFLSLGPDLTKEFDLPDLMNMTADEIENWADTNLMSKVRITSEFSATVPLGNVIEYEINDNTVVDKVKRSTPIYILVSKGAEAVTAKEITIPDFKTMGVTETVLFAQENGLNLTIDKQYDDYVPENSIIAQSVPKDSTAYAGDDIKIIVSLGQKRLMISLYSFSKEEAMSKASQLGVSYTVSERYSSSKKGRLIWQSIEEGTELNDDMHLELRFSLGSQIYIGNYVGSPKSSIEKWLQDENALGARATVNYTYSKNAAAPGTIIQQSVADTYIYRDKMINVVVSSGAIIYCPDFVAPAGSSYEDAVTREKAIELADGLDITLVFMEASSAGRLAGEVWYQSIAAGTEVSAGTTVTLKYNPLGTSVVVPDFKGKTQAEVMAMSEYSKLNVTFAEGDYDINYAGKVLSQTISASTTVAQGTSIILYVSPETMVTVPDFTGMTQEEVENSPDYNKLDIVFTTGDSGNPADAGKVYAQDVAAFSYLPKDTQVILTLGTGS